MGDNVPLLNEYKRAFFWKRLPQTLLGGPKLRLGYPAPAYVYLGQGALFAIPLLLGGIVSVLVEVAGLGGLAGGLAAGGAVGVYVLAARLVSGLARRRSAGSSRVRPNRASILAEEDEVDFEGCLGAETLDFVLPAKRWRPNVLLHATAAGATAGPGLLYLLPATLNALYGASVGATVVLYALGWLVLGIALYPLTVASPPEPAVFRTVDSYETVPLMRAFHVCLFCVVDLIWRSYPDIVLLNQILHVVFVFLPLLWTLGLLPPIDAFLLWLGEQTLLLAFGGSPMATDLRLIVMLLASGGTLVVAYFLPSTSALVVFSACLGYLLSLDLAGLAGQLLAWCRRRRPNRPRPLASPPPVGREWPAASGTSPFGWRWGWRELLAHLLALIAIGGVAFVGAHFRSSADVSVLNGLGYGMVAVRCLLKVLADAQSVYFFFGLLRNKLFPESVQSMAKYGRHKRALHRLAYLYRFLRNAVSPLLALAYLALFLAPPSLALPSFLLALGSVRSLRKIWQDTPRALLELSIVHVTNSALTIDPTSWWVAMGVGGQQLLVGALLGRSLELLDKLYCMAVLLLTSYSLEKQRRSSSGPLLAVSLLLLPLLLAVAGLAALLSAPLLPLFTLPVFLLGFPRPSRAWPGPVGHSANTCNDSVYYKQLVPTLSRALSRAVTDGSLGNPTSGCHYLVRFQDRMAWLQVLESGFGYCTLSLKGLELQETSCHTVEAGRLDDLFETSFERAGRSPLCRVNAYPMNTLTPMDALPVETYSDARNVLTGIIDSPDMLRSIDRCFVQTLVWVLLHHNSHKRRDRTSSSSPAKSPSPAKRAATREAGLGNGLAPTAEQKPAVPDGKTKVSDSWENRDSGRPSSVHSRPGSQGKPLASSWGSLKSWGDDDDSLDFEPDAKPKKPAFGLANRGTRGLGESPALPGAPDGLTDDDEDEILKELNFGPPAVQTANAGPAFPEALAMHPMPPHGQPLNLAGSVQLSSRHSSRLSLPLKWRHLPVDAGRLAPLTARFPRDWYRRVLHHLDLSRLPGMPADVTAEIAADEALAGMYVQLTTACYAVVNVFGLNGPDVVSAGASHVYKVYSGDVPWSTNLDWLKEDEELYSLVIKAYRFAFKLAYDQAVLGEAEDLDEIAEYLQQYQTDYFFGRDSDPEWAESVERGIPQLFSLLHDPSKGVYKSRVLTRQPVAAHVGRLNGEVVRALWAALNLELLYFTNDDEERYSIQAHPGVLRNLTIQAADPPLGYPIYASPPVTIPTL